MRAPAKRTSHRKPEPDNVYDPAWLVGRIQEAGPIAVYLLGHGLAGEDGDLVGRIQRFAGDDNSIEVLDDIRDFVRIVNWITQAYAVGIAVGQRLQPDAFNASGGVR